MKPSTTFRFCMLICAALYTGRLGTAAIIVSTFSSTPPGYINEGAMAFTVPATSDYLVTGISAALYSNSVAALAYFTIASPDSRGAPGTALDLIQIAVPSATPGVYSGASSAQPLLTKGSTCWLELAVQTVGTNVNWNATACAGFAGGAKCQA